MNRESEPESNHYCSNSFVSSLTSTEQSATSGQRLRNDIETRFARDFKNAFKSEMQQGHTPLGCATKQPRRPLNHAPGLTQAELE